MRSLFWPRNLFGRVWVTGDSGKTKPWNGWNKVSYHINTIYPCLPNTWSEGFWGSFFGSKYLLTRCLEASGYETGCEEQHLIRIRCWVTSQFLWMIGKVWKGHVFTIQGHNELPGMCCFFSLSQGVCFSGVGEFVECLNMCVFLFWMFAMGGVGSLLSSDLRYTLAVFPCFTERMDSVYKMGPMRYRL